MEQIEEGKIYSVKEICRRLSFSLIIPLVSIFYPILNRYRGNLNVVKLPIDDMIPFSKVFILPYVSWYPFVATFVVILCFVDKEKYFKLVVSLALGMIVSYVIYYFYPTYVERPFVGGRDFLSNLVLWLYRRDNPYNCWPSIHVLNSFLVVVYITGSAKVNKIAKIICIIIATLIILATMFLKQHYFSDVVSAMVLGSILYMGINVFEKYMVKDKLGNGKISLSE
jgi:membrane-associated phospholipid phosphatase